jgi:hypothetical protein
VVEDQRRAAGEVPRQDEVAAGGAGQLQMVGDTLEQIEGRLAAGAQPVPDRRARGGNQGRQVADGQAPGVHALAEEVGEGAHAPRVAATKGVRVRESADRDHGPDPVWCRSGAGIDPATVPGAKYDRGMSRTKRNKPRQAAHDGRSVRASADAGMLGALEILEARVRRLVARIDASEMASAPAARKQVADESERPRPFGFGHLCPSPGVDGVAVVDDAPFGIQAQLDGHVVALEQDPDHTGARQRREEARGQGLIQQDAAGVVKEVRAVGDAHPVAAALIVEVLNHHEGVGSPMLEGRPVLGPGDPAR